MIVFNVIITLGVLVCLAYPLGIYISKVMDGEKTFMSRIISPFERVIYKFLKIDNNNESTWKEYLIQVLLFSLLSFLVVFLLCLLQGFLFLNPEGIEGNNVFLAFNTAVSFMTNTNWQAYSGESALSYLTQMVGLTVQNFVSPAVGICVLYVLIRGIKRRETNKLGSFYVDLTRSILYVLLPLSSILCILLMSQGVVQNFNSYKVVDLIEPFVDSNGNLITQQIIPMGPAASQIAIKQLGTNGGGFFGVNSAFPLENPTLFSNFLQTISILLIPAALCFSFGRSVRNNKAGYVVFGVMFSVLILCLIATIILEFNVQYTQDVMSGVNTVLGNLEGKESRFGVGWSSIWGVFTTAASNGSVNSMHDSYSSLSGMILMFLMQLGEVIFGGVGCGLYGMLGFVIITVFICGLMVGRIPEYLGKKVEAFEMRMAMIVCLATPLAVLLFSAIAALSTNTIDSLNNTGAHGFSELLYAFSSAGGNNGSAFAGFGADTPLLNILLGLAMLTARFLPIIAIIMMAGSLAKKKYVPTSDGTLKTETVLFAVMIFIIVFVVGALSFLPALCLGPINEFFI